MRIPLLIVSAIAMLTLAAAPPAMAEAPHELSAIHTLSVAPPVAHVPLALVVVQAAAADSVPATTPPPASNPINGYQMAIVTFLGSLLTYLLSHFWPGFSALGDIGKWGIVLLASLIVSGVVHLIHGDLSPDVSSALKAAIDGLVAAVTSGGIFKFGTTKPA